VKLPEFEKLDELFNPKSVALVGASPNPYSGGYAYAVHLLEDFKGRTFLVNPKVDEILGVKTYPSLMDIPERVDYVICSISAEKVLRLLDECSRKGVKLVHLFTARMAETGRSEGARLEKEIVKKARELGIRLLGPNCMGLYNPEVGLTYGYWFPKEGGSVGAIFQSGGASTDFVHYGTLRGLRFSKVVSYGNGADIDESELLYYFAHDRRTRVIAMYVEGVKNGKKFIDALQYATERKPVVVLKGGRGSAGARSVKSHTASLAGRMEVWRAVFKKCNAVEVETFDELIDQVVVFSFLPPIRGYRVLIAGGGGGKSVFSADQWEEEGFELPDLSPQARERLKEIAPGVWDWLRNPIDLSILQDTPLLPEELFRIVGENEEFDLFVFNLTEDDPLPLDLWEFWMGEQIKGVLRFKREGKPVVAVVSNGEVSMLEIKEWRWGLIAEMRKRMIDGAIPVFSSPRKAARAVKRAIEYWRRSQGNSVNLSCL